MRKTALAGSLGLALFLMCSVPVRAQAPTVPPGCSQGTLPSGALWLICVPGLGWNGDLVVYAHGYVNPGEPLDFYNLELPDGTNIPGLIQSLGYAFATTSYRQNGLAVPEGVDDVLELVAKFPGVAGREPAHIWLTGPSDGGLVTVLAAERAPNVFTGAYATCGPIGNFQSEVNYLGDFRVLFDYFFPGQLPGSPIDIPQDVITNWESVYVPQLTALFVSHPSVTLHLLSTAKAPYDKNDPATAVKTAIDILSYNVLRTNDAVAKLGGNPFDNHRRWYWGSGQDLRLNLLVQRFRADPAALAAMQSYTTSGDLRIPLVTLHTTGDPLVPFGHELIYLAKVRPSGRGRFVPLPVFRYGHCNFTTTEVLAGLGLLVRFP
jgi:hypothetical protein